jgi:hypothetical protein
MKKGVVNNFKLNKTLRGMIVWKKTQNRSK